MNLVKYFFISITLLGVSSCNHCKSEYDRTNEILNDSSQTITVYNGLKLGITKQEEELIIKNDSSSYLFSKAYRYKFRKIKALESSSSDKELSKIILTEFLGVDTYDALYGNDPYSNNIYKFYEKIYKNDIKYYKKELREEPSFGKCLLDYYLDDSYRGEIIIDFNEHEFEKIVGWYSYQTYNDTVYSVTCMFDVMVTDPQEISKYTDGFKRTLIKKYGSPNELKPYFGEALEICSFLPDTTGNSNYDLLWRIYEPVRSYPEINITNSIFWKKGRYEVQLYINETNQYYAETTKIYNYEFIIRYVDNKFLLRHIENMNKVKIQKIRQFEQNKLREESEKQRELSNEQKNQQI